MARKDQEGLGSALVRFFYRGWNALFRSAGLVYTCYVRQGNAKTLVCVEQYLAMLDNNFGLSTLSSKGNYTYILDALPPESSQ